MNSLSLSISYQGRLGRPIMYTSAGFVPCNGQHITSQHQPEYHVVSQVHKDLNYTQQNMDRKELTLSFHNLIKRGSVCV